MSKYDVTLKLYTYDWSQEPHKRIDIDKTFVCDSWDAAKDLIGLMIDSTDTLNIEIKRREVEGDE